MVQSQQIANMQLNVVGLRLRIGGTSLQEKQSTKFLGMLIYSKLDSHVHIIYIASKSSKSLYGLKRVKHYLPPQTPYNSQPSHIPYTHQTFPYMKYA